MKKQTILTLIIAFTALAAFAQDRPGWIYTKPSPANTTYLYVVESAVGNTEMEARNAALGEVFRSTAMRIGQPFDSEEVNKALQQGTSYSVISHQYNIPINKVCEYSERSGSGYKVYVLCQVASKGNISVQWSDFTQCTRQGVEGMAVLKSALLPGLGQFHKGQTTKGALFLSGEVASVAGIVVCQSMRKTSLNKMNSTTSSTLKKKYADRANAFTLGRNICIGAAGAIYIWNILDAIISKSNRGGALSYGGPVNLTPVVTDEAVALSVNIKF